MGSRSKIRKSYNIKGILSKRIFDITSSQKLTNEELGIAAMESEDFDKWLSDEKQKTFFEGTSFISPGGRPLMRLMNSNYYTEPVCFNFELSVDLPIVEDSHITINGELYSNVSICFYGSYSLNLATKRKTRLCFGYAHVGDMTHVFGMTRPGRPFVYRLNRESRNFAIFNYARYDWLVIFKKDLTPIIDGSFGMKIEPVFNPLMTGDTTAILNYGNYINTNATGAIKRMKQIFKHFDSDFPNHISRIKPNYPHHPDRTVIIPFASNNVLLGHKSSTLLRLIPSERSSEKNIIDLNGPSPVLHEDVQIEVEENWS